MTNLDLDVSEGTIIYNLLFYGETPDIIFDNLEPRYFTDQTLQEIFRIGKELYKKNEYTVQTLLDELRKQGFERGIKDALEASLTSHRLPNIDELKSIITYIREEYTREHLKENLSQMTVEDIQAMLQTTFENNGKVIGADRIDSIIKEMMAKDSERFPYPSKMLNSILGGIAMKEYTIIAARPSTGKTAFIEQIFWDSTKAGKKCLFVSLEMSEEGLFKRHILRKTGKDLFRDSLAWEERARLYDGIKDALGKSKIAAGAFSAPDIDRLIKENKPEIVLIDYLQQVASPRYLKGEFEQVTYATKQLAQLKMKYNIALVVASQYSRQVDEQPRLSDLRSSGQIEQDADVVISLWKKKDDDDLASDSKVVHIDCLKNRNGRVFGNNENKEFTLLFNPKRVLFYDAVRSI